MISIAGVIGGSLFVSSGGIIYNTQPCSFLTYAFWWSTHVWFIMRMLGEMAVLNPTVALFNLCRPLRLVVGQGFQLVGCTGARWRCSLGWEAYVAGKDFKQLVPVYTDLGFI